jgi:hypothetical protein
MGRRTRLILAVIPLFVILAVAMVALLRSRLPLVARLAGFSESDVQVDLSLEQNLTAPCVLAARYTPLEEHFHLYSKDLPPDGVNGAGRPTRLDIISGLVATGELTADATTIDFKTQGIPEVLPVYPDGPVTLRLPVRAAGDGSARVKMSYMACSALMCLPPVAKTLDIHLSQC